MKEQAEFDYMPIRNRLADLKEKAGMDALEFCKIYAPEKYEKTEGYARTYISQVFSGGTSFNNKPVLPDIEHLLNIVNSDKFPEVTLDYLVYGDETPAKTVEKLDLNPEHWTIADFCLFLGKLMELQPSIRIKSDLLDEEYIGEDGTDTSTSHYLSICFREYEEYTGNADDLGGALHAFTSAYENMKNIDSDTARKVMYEQIITAVKSDKRFSNKLSSNEIDNFHKNYENGPTFVGLDIK